MAHFFIEEKYREGNEKANWSEELRFKAGLKKHISVNRMLPMYQHYAKLANKPADVIQEDNFHTAPATIGQRIRNPIGNILLETGSPDFKDYLLRLAHLDARIRLMRHLDRSTQSGPVSNNPWTPGKDDTLTRQKKQLCFATAPDSDRYSSCLPLL